MITNTVLIIALTIVGKHNGVQCDDLIDKYLSLSLEDIKFPDGIEYWNWITRLMNKDELNDFNSLENGDTKGKVKAASTIMHDILANIFKGIIYELQLLCRKIKDDYKTQEITIGVQKKIFQKIYKVAITTTKLVNSIEVDGFKKDNSETPFFTNKGKEAESSNNIPLMKYDHFKAFVPNYLTMWRFVFSGSNLPKGFLTQMGEMNTEGRLIKNENGIMQVRLSMLENNEQDTEETDDLQCIQKDNSVKLLLEMYVWMLLLQKCGFSMFDHDKIKTIVKKMPDYMLNGFTVANMEIDEIEGRREPQQTVPENMWGSLNVPGPLF